MARDIDRLNPLPDSSIEEASREYLMKHNIDGFIGGLLEKTLKNRPPDVLQYIADCLEFGPEEAQQDSSGSITFNEISSYATALSLEELNEIFNDFSRENRMHITMDRFLMFFGRIALPMNNHHFKELVDEMMA
ncbi:hypothetical protein BSKO_04731 [Bryopsis sp. KO-2023]|nr:hypothetical protein BSKO_04731 [Bryopsis sp. KO-2023]